MYRVALQWAGEQQMKYTAGDISAVLPPFVSPMASNAPGNTFNRIFKIALELAGKPARLKLHMWHTARHSMVGGCPSVRSPTTHTASFLPM